MAPKLDADIWYLVISVLRAEYASSQKSKRLPAKEALIALRLTSRFLAATSAPALLSHIDILKLDSASLKRLRSLLKSPDACKLVKTYNLKPDIIGSRQGDLTSAYHKIPPYLDYGRNSASPQIRAENKRVLASMAHFETQNNIIYPIKSKVAASLAKTFKWSGYRGDSQLKDSVYFAALDAFSSLQTLLVTYPSPRPSKLFHDVAAEFSFALGRYLATNPGYLTDLRIYRLVPSDLPMLVNVLTGSLKPNQKLSLCTTRLDLFIENTDSLIGQTVHDDPEFSSSLSTLLQHMPDLTSLRIVYHRNAPNAHLHHLLLSPFTPPPLPALKTIALTRLALSAHDLQAIINFSPIMLTNVRLDTISLTGPSWARVLRSFCESDTMSAMSVTHLPGMSYLNSTNRSFGGGLTDEDHLAHVQWHSKTYARPAQFGDEEMFEVEA